MINYESFDTNIHDCLDNAVLNILNEEIGEYWRILSHPILNIKYEADTQYLKYISSPDVYVLASIKEEYGIEFIESKELKERWNLLYLPLEGYPYKPENHDYTIIGYETHAIIIEKCANSIQLIDPPFGIVQKIDDTFIHQETQVLMNAINHGTFKKENVSMSDVFEKIKSMEIVLSEIYDETIKFMRNDLINSNQEIYNFLADYLLNMMRQEFRFIEYIYQVSKFMNYVDELILYSIYNIIFNLTVEWKVFWYELVKQKFKGIRKSSTIEKIRNKLDYKGSIKYLSYINSNYLEIYKKNERLNQMSKKYFSDDEMRKSVKEISYYFSNMFRLVGEIEEEFNIELDVTSIPNIETPDELIKNLSIVIIKLMAKEDKSNLHNNR